jgi:hypothetical protein
MGVKRNVNRALVAITKGKRPLGRPRSRRFNYNEIGLRNDSMI